MLTAAINDLLQCCFALRTFIVEFLLNVVCLFQFSFSFLQSDCDESVERSVKSKSQSLSPQRLSSPEQTLVSFKVALFILFLDSFFPS